MTFLYAFLILMSAVLLLLIFILIFPVNMGIEYIQDDKETKFFARFKLFGIPIKIPIKNAEKQKPQQKGKIQKEEKEKKDIKTYVGMPKKIYKAYSDEKDEIKSILGKVRKEIAFENMLIDVGFGMGDAAMTGIYTGYAWTAATLFLKLIKEIFGVEKYKININPDFNQKCLKVHIISILRLKPVYIINVILRLIKVINVFKNKITNEKGGA